MKIIMQKLVFAIYERVAFNLCAIAQFMKTKFSIHQKNETLRASLLEIF